MWQSQSLLPWEKVPQFANWGGCGVPQFRITSFVGRFLDPATKPSPWGKVAWRSHDGCGVVTFLLAPKEPIRNSDTPHPSKIGSEEPIFATLESRYDCPRQSWLLQDSLRGAPPRWGNAVNLSLMQWVLPPSADGTLRAAFPTIHLRCTRDDNISLS